MALIVHSHMVFIKRLLYRVHPCPHQTTVNWVIFMNWKHKPQHVSQCVYNLVQFWDWNPLFLHYFLKILNVLQMLVICDLYTVGSLLYPWGIIVGIDCYRLYHITHKLPFKDVFIFTWLLPHPAGLRIGKGEGFADMEYGMMSSMGAVNDSTVVVTVVHDCQVSLFIYQSHMFSWKWVIYSLSCPV